MITNKKVVIRRIRIINKDTQEEVLRPRTKKVITDDAVEVQKIQIKSLQQLPQRKKQLIIDDDDEMSEFEITKRKSSKLKKKQDIIIQAAQQDSSLCSICLYDLKRLQVASLPCSHVFCLNCIKTQAEQYQNICPLCRKQFGSYTLCVKSIDGELMRGDAVRVKQQRNFRSDEDENEDDVIVPIQFNNNSSYDAEDSFLVPDQECCEVCGLYEDAEMMVYCSECQRMVHHIYCNQQKKAKCFGCRQ
ncbi:E3 ubiquitin-protein ligase rnf4 [Paramecium bursaria]